MEEKAWIIGWKVEILIIVENGRQVDTTRHWRTWLAGWIRRQRQAYNFLGGAWVSLIFHRPQAGLGFVSEKQHFHE
jgi:hypothetical protein